MKQAKATTPELLVSIIKTKKIVLVGDQNQLPAYADQELSPIISQLTKMILNIDCLICCLMCCQIRINKY